MIGSTVIMTVATILAVQGNMMISSVPTHTPEDLKIFMKEVGTSHVTDTAWTFTIGLQSFVATWVWMLLTSKKWPYNIVAIAISFCVYCWWAWSTCARVSVVSKLKR